MNTILPTVFSFTASKKVITAVLLLFSTFSFAQIVDNIFPTRVTTGSKVTIIGSGFTSGDENNISIADISIGSKTFVSPTEMTFKITRTGSGQSDKTLSVTGATYTVASRNITYVRPESQTITEGSEFRVREVYTSWDQNGDGENFWNSGSFSYGDTSNWPNDRHDLLGFKMTYDNIDYIFSTGVDNATLESKLTSLGVDGTSVVYVAQEYKAYSTNGVSGKPNSNNFIGMADKIDGYPGLIRFNDAVRKTVYDVIIDGENNLDLGTGIANFNNDADIRFYSGNGSEGTSNDSIPDLLITQMAKPGGSDVYYYADVDGNVIGTPIKVIFQDNTSSRLYEWFVDFYKMNTSANFDASFSTGAGFSNGGHRSFRMAAFQLDDFDITDDNIGLVDNINMGAGGSSDMSFLAYNKSAFEIKSPIIDKLPVSRYICRLPSPDDTTLIFEALGSVEEGSGDPRETIKYEWFKNHISLTETSNTYTINGSLEASDIENVTYRVRVSNDFGAVDLPFTINEGGTPTYWNGTNWELPSAYTENNVTVDDRDRSLVFSNDYNQIGDLVGCDCTVTAGKNVIIPSGTSITLFNDLTVEGAIPSVEVDGEYTDEIPAGVFTLEDDASLVQINDVENSGEIIVKRTVEGETLHAYDYVYWSTPVEDASVSTMPGNLKFKWDVDGANTVPGAVGNWTSATGIMEIGRGYIARVSSAIDYTAAFTGTPNNGDINIEVKKTPTSGSTSMASGEKHWNLIGNPYPSAIDPAKLLSNNTNLDGAVYVWTHSDPISASVDDPFYDNFNLNYSDQYIAYNGTGSSRATNEGENYIASGQGFFVKVLDAADSSSNVTFTNAMRYNDAEEAYDNDQFYRSSTEAGITTEKQLLWLSLADENDSAISTLIGYVEGATEGKDRVYDAQTNNGGFNIYSLTSEDDNLVIQGLPLPFVDYNTVPLGYEVSASGIYRIAIADVKGSIFEEQEQDIYVEDTYTGVVHDLRASTYAFTSESGVFNDRFILRYTPSVTLSVDEIAADTTFAFINNATLNVKSSDGIKAIEVYDINGKTVVNYTLRGSENTFNTNFNFARGVYVASITLDNGSVVTKKLMN